MNLNPSIEPSIDYNYISFGHDCYPAFGLRDLLNSKTPLFILYNGSVNEIKKFKHILNKKYKKTNIFFIVFQSGVSSFDDDSILLCNNSFSELLDVINVGKQKM